MRDAPPGRDTDVVLGDDWVAPASTVEAELQERRARRKLISFNKSPLTRKIVTFNLIALTVLVAGILYLNSSRDSLAYQRGLGLVAESELLADVIEARLDNGDIKLDSASAPDIAVILDGLDLKGGTRAFVFNLEKVLIGQTRGSVSFANIRGLDADEVNSTPIIDLLNRLWSKVSVVIPDWGGAPPSIAEQLNYPVETALTGSNHVVPQLQLEEGTVYTVTAPIEQGGRVVGAVALTGVVGEIDALVRSERERVLQMFVVATLVSIGLSLVLSSTISNPISDLAAAAELGGDKNRRGKHVAAGRVRIPDLTARPDEIGRLSGALRGMVSALYDRIDANEQFAADVAHEIKNPLASLRSAVGTLRLVKKDEQRAKLLDVIEHDVRRLDRLVSDISNASRLDSELVKEEEERFDLLKMIGNLSDYLGQEAKSKGIDFISDLPKEPIHINGLEARLAQVFVNLITNAISFCEDGDAIRVWARKRENRVLVVVEDTGPGIPEQALTKIFKRFYSERPASDYGNNSGLGLAISKQIVEAHGGVIWAENIRPTEADATSDPLGARFVVGLPV